MPIIDQPALIKPQLNLVIWRYIDLVKFESLLNEKCLFFCRSDKFSDPFEGSIPKRVADFRPQPIKAIFDNYQRNLTDEELINKSNEMGQIHKNFKRGFIVNCWHINQGESDAMWRLYLKTNEGVAIQTTVNRLRDSFNLTNEEISISKVRYLDYDKDIFFDESVYPIQYYNVIPPIIHKRKAFIHENELRLFQQINEAIYNANYWDDKPNHLGKLIPIDIDTLIENVILPPTSDEIVKERVNKLINNYGLNSKIVQSKLSEEPNY